MASGFIDSLKLVLSDSLDMSDSEYKALSDILVSQGLSDTDFDSGLVQMIYLMVKYHHRFPISITFLRELWEYENISFNFVKMIGDLLKNGKISLRKVKRETFFGSDNITKSNSEDLDRDIYVVIYGTTDFNRIFSEFERVFNSNKSPIQESGVVGITKKFSDIVSRASSLLKTLNIKVELESFTSDSVLGTSRMNLILSQTSDYSYKDRDIQRIASKHLKGKYIQGVEAYKESEDEIFLGFDVSNSETSYKSVSDGIYTFVEELEVNGGQ